MELQLPPPQRAPEAAGQFSRPEALPTVPRPEAAPVPRGPEASPEHGADAGERPSQVVDNAGAPPVAVPLPPSPVVPAANPATSATSSPATAADEDLIEKEWVEKAKKVIADTRHDPYLQEQEVSKLQADYLMKRYSKAVKLPSEG